MNLSAEHVYLAVGALVVVYMLLKRKGDVTSVEARKLVQEGARLVDVRSPGEFASGHIDGALNIPVNVIGNRATEIGPKDKPVILYCASGARSATAARVLKSKGFGTVRNLGAMSRW